MIRNTPAQASFCQFSNGEWGVTADAAACALEDLAGFQAGEAPPLRFTYRGYDLYMAPPSSYGHVMLEALNETGEGRDSVQMIGPTIIRSSTRRWGR